MLITHGLPKSQRKIATGEPKNSLFTTGTHPRLSQDIPADKVVLSGTQPSTNSASVSVGLASPSFGRKLLDWATGLGSSRFRRQLEGVEKAAESLGPLETPKDFQAKTHEFKRRLAGGESLNSIRNEAYAVARLAAEKAVGMRPYDSQVVGALAMDGGHIAEMMTGEGKTLTAVLPLYLNALSGKGAHLVTVNDRLAQRDRDEMAPVFELLGLTVGCALESMSDEEKRRGYACDVTYTTDRALGFDFLKDRLARRAEDRLQRPLHFALVDEVDQVLLDEARTPLIISGKGDPPSPDYLVFQEIVEELRPGVEYYVDRENGAAWLTETGTDFVQNELHRDQLSLGDPQAVAHYHKRRAAIRAEGNAWKALRDHREDKPGLFSRWKDGSWSETDRKLADAHRQAAEDSEELGCDYNLFAPENLHRTRALYASLQANALFEEGVDYLVQDHRVQIVDENKGRTSKGRRFNEGLHQALEAKSQVPLRTESRPVASITYPNLFAKYERLAGMSGTAKSSESEFSELYDLDVVRVPTNLQFQANPEHPERAPRHHRIDHTDMVFASKKEKFQAVVEETVRAYQEGVPVLVGTLSVEANEYLYSQLLKSGIDPGAIQVLNANHVREDLGLENQVIAQAGRSGMITVATNMAGRGVNIKPDLVNYKKLALGVEKAIGDGQGSVTIDVASPEQARRLAQWLDGNYPYRIGADAPGPGEALIRVAAETPARGPVLKAEDFPTGGLYVIGTERGKSRRVDDQLIGRAGRNGAPGQSRFFISLEDDLFQYFGGSHLESALKLLGGKGGHLESDLVQGLVDKVQARVAMAEFATREDTSDYDKTLNKQREAFFTVRDSVLEPEADLKDKLLGDAAAYLNRYLESELRERRVGPERMADVLKDLNTQLGLHLTWSEKKPVKTAEVGQQLEGQLRQQLSEALAQLEQGGVAFDEPYRQLLLDVYDRAWSGHLEDMRGLRQGVQWVAVAEKDPEVEYSLRGYEIFEAMTEQVCRDSIQLVVPEIMRESHKMASAGPMAA